LRFKSPLAGLLTIALLCTFAQAQTRTNVAQQIAPTGTLRAVINLGNPILAKRENATSQPVGVSVDLAQALAQKLNLPLTLIAVESAAKSVETVTQGQADVGFLRLIRFAEKALRIRHLMSGLKGATWSNKTPPWSTTRK